MLSLRRDGTTQGTSSRNAASCFRNDAAMASSEAPSPTSLSTAAAQRLAAAVLKDVGEGASEVAISASLRKNHAAFLEEVP